MNCKCFRCGHEWLARKVVAPKVCPKCKTPYWDTLRGIQPLWKSMKATERLAYNWLSGKYDKESIIFQHSTSPDFLIGDTGYEVKKFLGYKIRLNRSQWDNLIRYKPCYIVVFDTNPDPITTIPIDDKTPPFTYEGFIIELLPDPLAKYNRHLEIMRQVPEGLKGKEFWDEYHRIKASA